jgi:serine/threonine protein kinase
MAKVNVECRLMQLSLSEWVTDQAPNTSTIHRDIKPEYVLVSNDIGQFKICDFRYAKMVVSHKRSGFASFSDAIARMSCFLKTPIARATSMPRRRDPWPLN